MARQSNTRSAQGSGSIRQRSNGRWEARYTVGHNPSTGTQIRRSIYGSSEKEVLKKLQQVQVDIEVGAYTEPQKMTVGEWLEIWLKDYTMNIKPSTLSSYAHNVNSHIVPALGSIPLQKLNPHTVQGFYNTLLKSGRIKQKCHKKEMPDGLSARSVNFIHTVLHMALRQAIKLSYMRVNPTEACILPRVPKREMTILQGEQIPKFIDAASNHSHKALFLTLLFTGIRIGEALGLTWDCVDSSNGIIHIRKQLQRERVKGGQLQLVSLKNDKERKLSPPTTLFHVLAEHKQKQDEWQYLLEDLWVQSELVFTNDIGGALDNQGVYNAFKRMLSYNDLPSIRLHDLRHTAATLMLQNGDDYKTLQDALGHHSAGFTLDTYGHVTDKMKKDSADRMEAFIQSLPVSV